MSRLSRSARLVRNAESALISAIEVYNKPAFAYREETFSILALNAWELLLKAKLLADAENDPRCLYVYEKRKTAVGQPSKKRYVKRNRSGNIMTVGIEACLARLENGGVAVPLPVRRNLEALIEIRDNAVHYLNAGTQLSKQVLEIGTASLRNFIELGKRWFELDLSRYNLYLMPIGFLPGAATAVALSPEERNVVKFLAGLMKQGEIEHVPDYHVSLEVNISFKRSSGAAATAVIVTNDPNAIKVTVSEEDIRQQYPWDYGQLTKKLKERYMDFKENGKYHRLRKPLMNDARYVKARFLDPGNPRSSRKDFYSPNIIVEFDKSYTLRP